MVSQYELYYGKRNPEEYMDPIHILWASFCSNNISREEFLEQMELLAETRKQHAAQREEEWARQIEETQNIKMLLTDEYEGKSESWFMETGKAFATGVARPCIAVAVVHPDVGIGASHRNPITSKLTRRSLERLLCQKGDLPESSPDTLISQPTPDDLRETTTQAVSEAIEAFQDLHPSRHIPNGTAIVMTGFDFADPKPTEALGIETTMQVLNNMPGALPTNSQNLEITINAHFGVSGGIIYGGKLHPLYNTPQFYQMK